MLLSLIEEGLSLTIEQSSHDRRIRSIAEIQLDVGGGRQVNAIKIYIATVHPIGDLLFAPVLNQDSGIGEGIAALVCGALPSDKD